MSPLYLILMIVIMSTPYRLIMYVYFLYFIVLCDNDNNNNVVLYVCLPTSLCTEIVFSV